MRHRISACLAILTIATIFCSSSIATAQDDAELKSLREANAQLKAELEAAKLRIETLEKLIESMRAKDAKDNQKQAQDLFTVGSIWSGSRFYNQNGKTANRQAQPWRMEVTERDGKKFRAVITFTAFDGLEKEITVVGTAPVTAKGGVTFKTDQKGIFQQSFNGVLAGQQVSLEFDGTGVEGTRVFGTGDLKRE